VADGKLLAELGLHKDEVTCVAFFPDGGMLASSSYEAVRVWRLPDGKLLRTLEEQEGQRRGGFDPLAFSPDGSVLAAGAHLWRISDGELLRRLPGDSSDFRGFDFLSDSKLLHWGTLKGPNFAGFVFSPDWTLAAVEAGRVIEIRRVADGKSLLKLIPKGQARMAFRFFVRRHMLAASWCEEGDNRIDIWSMPDGKKLRMLEKGMGGATVAFSKDGTFLAAGTGDLLLWRIADGELLKRFSLNGVHSVTFCPNNSWLAAGCDDKAIRLWPLRRRAVR
jgi:WD40 repeat protein